MQPLSGLLVVDFTRYLPGAFASRELLELGARVVCVEPPGGDPMRATAPAWDAALRAGKESLEVDLKQDPAPALELLREADVVLESFRPGVARRLGIGPERAPERTVYCSITGFGLGGRHEQRAGHDLNYLGWAGVLWDTAPALPPVQIADLAAGALGAVTKILAALLERDRTGKGAHVSVSLTHGSHRFVSHRLGGDAVPRMLTGGLACYRLYETANGRHLTVAALEPRFFRRLTELLGRPELAERRFDVDQEALADELGAIFATRTLADWLELFEGEDVCVGPVATLAEAAADLAPAPGWDRPVPETPEQFWERARTGLRTPPVEEWDSWPFVGAPTPRELEAPVDEEPPRHGVGGVDCWHCNPTNVVWSDASWVLRSLDEPSGLPVVVLLETKRHVDFPDLDDELAAELGPLLLRIHRAVAQVPGVGRVHVGRWGEGSEHCHIWFMGRTARMMQFRSSFAAIWDDVLPPTPEDVWRENLELVRAALEGEVARP